MPRLSALSMPRRPDGILDIMGPNTLEGGYSPSQVMSSYSGVDMKRGGGVEVVRGMKVVGLVRGTGGRKAFTNVRRDRA